ncbi:MAG: winged helix-turn-helix transcriptional regulator [Streptosporangiaceae bacterium]|nr:winged helix-turn-helix transcriptional regulator [Streptosporangiaceae bacterium]MBV9857318.1 winged helix-turn-helix transcriptional regulator [Streptosporangiaceae bacterium]
MSLEVERRQVVAALRARAHPLRLRMLSLLTGAALSAAELARELGVSQALASYHLRQLSDAGLVELAETRSHRGGRERRYRHRVELGSDVSGSDDEGRALFVEAVVEELRRRVSQRSPGLRGLAIDAELWVHEEDWEEARQAIAAAGTVLHEKACRPHEPGTVHINATVVMFRMLDPDPPDQPDQPGPPGARF